MVEQKRTPIAAGNWKMNLSRRSARKLVDAIRNINYQIQGVEIILAPPFTFLPLIADWICGSEIKIAAQNMFWEEKGAFTGEISPMMLKECECEYVIIGHSERRNIFRENDEWINRKIKSAIRNELKPIFCIGEKLEERDRGKTTEVVTEQLDKGLKDLQPDELSGIIIAYEPVWAIGTGRSASGGDAQEVHHYIRGYLKKKYGKDFSANTRIIYGGSVKPSNISELISQKDIDGTLVGGASLKSDSFIPIIKSSLKR